MHLSVRPAALCAGLAGLLLLSTVFPAAARSDVEVAAGISTTTDRQYSHVVSAAWLPELRQLDKGVLRADVGVVHVDGRGEVRNRDLAEDVQVGYVGLRYERLDNGLSLGAAVGVQSGETDALSGDPQFITTAGWRWGRFSVLLRHISNASLHSPNHGETGLVAAWRF